MLEMITSNTEEKIDIFRQPTHIVPPNKPETLISYSLPWPDVSLIAFLRQAANAPRVYWESDKSSVQFAGCGIAAILTANGSDRFQVIRREASHLFQNIIPVDSAAPPAVGPRLFGGFAFWPEAKAGGLWSAFPAACFILPRYQLTRFKGQTWLTVNHRLGPEDDPMGIGWLLRREIRELEAATDRISGNGSGHLQSTGPKKLLAIDDLMAPATWYRLVADATRRIRGRELDKVVLARARRIRSPRPIDPADVLIRLKLSYPDCYRFLFEPIPGHAFYGATPELLAEVVGSALHTVALAGSIRRGSSPEEDEALGRQLMANPKERHEQALVVEAMQENLSPLATDLRVEPQPSLCRLSNIQHLQTVIEGKLTDNCGILSVVEALHPTPAVGGRPRSLALPIINEVEPTPRGWYASPVGWLDHQDNGMFAVAIRSAVSVGHESRLFAGAGIVADSIPEKEWRETQLKFRPLLEALGGVSPT